MDERRFAYQVSLLLTGLNLLAILVMLLATSLLAAVVTKRAPESGAALAAVVAVEAFLLLGIFATAVSITLYVKQRRRNEAPSERARTDVEIPRGATVVDIRRAG